LADCGSRAGLIKLALDHIWFHGDQIGRIFYLAKKLAGFFAQNTAIFRELCEIALVFFEGFLINQCYSICNENFAKNGSILNKKRQFFSIIFRRNHFKNRNIRPWLSKLFLETCS
jgi:hypothetical protein